MAHNAVKPTATQGKRNDLVKAVSALQEGASVLDVCLASPALVRNVMHLERLQGMLRHKKALTLDRSDLDVIWIYGPSGAGKSWLARDLAGDRPAYVLNKTAEGQQLWFDHYDGEEVLIMDEIRADWCSYSQLLRILDRYPVFVAKKGSTDSLLCTSIYITCTHPPELMYGGNAQGQRRVDRMNHLADVNDLTQLHRRIKKRFVFDGADGGYSEELGPQVTVTTVRPWRREGIRPAPPAAGAAAAADAAAADYVPDPIPGQFEPQGYGGF